MRLETKFVQVPNNPATINAINNFAAVWGWTVQSIQVTDSKITYEGDSYGWVSDYGAHVTTQVITEHTNYASITYQRDIEDAKYEKLKFLEEKYNQCDSISCLTDEEETEEQQIMEEFNKKHSTFKKLFIAAIITTIWGLSVLTMFIKAPILFVVGIIICIILGKKSSYYDDYTNNSQFRELRARDKARRLQVKQDIIDQAKAL